MEQEVCTRCVKLIGASTDGTHPRCSVSTCPCSCRDVDVDLAYPDTRLAVAAYCSAALSRPLEDDPSPEAAYVNGAVQDCLWALLREMTGLGVVATSPPAVREGLDEVEQAQVRSLLAEERLTGVELAALRAMLAPRAELQRPRPPTRHMVPQPEPEETEEEIAVDHREDYPQEASPPPPPAVAKRRGALRPVARPIPMPRGSALTNATADSASRSDAMGQRSFENANQHGGATGRSERMT